MADILKLVGTRIREIRKEKGLSQEQLGELSNFHFSYIGGLERGERNISLVNLEKITTALGVKMEYLFSYKQETTTNVDLTINEIMFLLDNRESKDIKMALNILTEIFNNYPE